MRQTEERKPDRNTLESLIFLFSTIIIYVFTFHTLVPLARNPVSYNVGATSNKHQSAHSTLS